MTKLPGGFRLRGNYSSEAIRIEVRVAYDRRTGSPLRHYRSEDFDLSSNPIRIEQSGATIEVVETNFLTVIPEGGDFEVIVTGFDRNRDLFLAARQAMVQRQVVVQCPD